MKFNNERLLIIAPHADDEIGCSGLINKIKKGGGKVFIQVLVMGGFNKIGSRKIKKEDWKKEFLQASNFLKVDDYEITFFDDEKMLRLDTIPLADIINILELKSKISISKIKPTIVAIPTIFFGWHTPNISQWYLIILMGFFGGVAQILATNAYKISEVTILTPFDYSSIIWAITFGIIFFNDYPDKYVILGSIVIVASTYYIIYREKIVGQNLNTLKINTRQI